MQEMDEAVQVLENRLKLPGYDLLFKIYPDGSKEFIK